MLKRLGLLLLTVATTLLAQTSERIVDSIQLNFKGAPPLAEQAVKAHIELKEGSAFTQAALDRSVRALFATGFFEDVKATPNDLGGGRIQLAFDLSGKLKVRTVSFEGNKKIKDKRLAQEISLKANRMLDAQQLAADARKIKALYEKRSYPYAKVITRTTPFEGAGLADITFVIDEGMKTKIEQISFEGNRAASDKQLRKILATRTGSVFSFLTGSGKVQDDALEDDLARLNDYYRNLGYLEVKVDGPAISPKGDGVRLTYQITEGTHYKVGIQSIEGNTIYTTDELAGLFKLTSGKALSPLALDATAAAIGERYGSQGYIETAVRAELLPSTTDMSAIDVVYRVRESEQYTVRSIQVEGNTTTKSVVVAREILLAPGDVFSTTKMKTSQARLKNTGYFESVELSDEPTDEPQQSDLNVTVTEGKTGNITFGVGLSSLDKATIFGEFTQGNFDLFNYRNFFRGDGQKFRLYASLSEESSDMILSLEEPWLFDRRLAGGFSLYRTETDYVSSVYDERRTGYEVYLRKRLVELIDGRLGLRQEKVDIFGVESSASPAILAEEGSRDVSKLTLALTRDTRDKPLMSTRGNRLELITAVAGKALGGDTDYWSVEARGAQYYPTSRWLVPQYLTLLGRVGTMDTFDSGERVPLFDKFFLGGPSTLRGFAYRKVGPKDFTGEPLGGKSYGFFSAEYAWQVADPFQIALFYDVGFVNTAAADWDPSDYNDNWGFGMRLLIMGAPLRLDYGIPITSDSQNDNGGKFWFSFGTRF
jgi:outer membrane protein insertion porin family